MLAVGGFFTQIIINLSATALYLLMQTLAEWHADIAIVRHKRGGGSVCNSTQYMFVKYPAYGTQHETFKNPIISELYLKTMIEAPFLWKMGYNYVLEIALSRSVQLICCADDTFLIASGKSFESILRSTSRSE